MDIANDNIVPEEWTELSLLNERYAFFTHEQMMQFKHRTPRYIANMLWYMKFELSFRRNQAREKIKVIK